MKSYLLILMTCATSGLAIAEELPKSEMELITVTSQRIEKSPLEVSSNITIFDEETIKSLNLTSLSELLALIPNFSMQSITGDYDYIQVRGMPRNYEQSTLSVFIDGVPYSSLYGLNIPLLNISSVEVIKGPQGNLFGRNTRDGIIVINTKNATNEVSGFAELSLAELNQKSLKASLNAAIKEDVLWFSIGGNVLQRDGTVKNTLLKNDVDPIDEHSSYAKLNWQLNDFNGQIKFNYEKKDNGLAPYVITEPPLKDGDPLEIALNIENKFKQKNTGISVDLNWDINTWKVSSITSYAKVNTAAEFDADYSDLPLGSYHSQIDEKDIYQEFRLTSHDIHSQLSWLIGASYNKNEQNNSNQYPLFSMETDVKLERENYLAYLDLIWQINQQWQLQAGTRYFDEEVTSTSIYTNPTYPVPNPITQGFTSHKDARFLSKAALNYQFSPEQRIYMSYGEGYLSAGTSWLMEYIDDSGMRQGTGTPYSPELSKNIEFGYKTNLSTYATQLELSVFDSQLHDYQYYYLTPFGFSRVTSIDEVTSQGIEFSISSQFTESLSWQMNVGINDAQVTSIGTQENDLDISKGDNIPLTPRFSVSNTLLYSFQLNTDWIIDANITWQHNDAIYFDFNKQQQQGTSNIFNTSLSFNYQQNWLMTIWANNLTDQRVQQFRIAMPGNDLANYITPRQIGLNIARYF